VAAITIIPFRDDLAAAFARLNQEWIERFFRMEESDRKTLNDPHGTVLAGGGQIFFALDGDTPVGAVAAVHVSPGVYELAKMAVSPSHQGRGIGEMLGHAAIDYALGKGAEMMFLDTNSALEPAIRLYERLGFAHAQRPQPSVYERSDVYMELRVDHS
jgi:GNAT superfamily N-acetyltransferase